MRKYSAFLIPVLDRWLLYAPLHKVSALVNGAAAKALRAGAAADDGSALAELSAAIGEPPQSMPRALDGDVCPSFLGIMPTRGCNLACVYCNFGGPTAAKVFMNPDIAVSAVNWMADRLVKAGRRDFQIHFFGGEPFIAPDIVDIVVHRARYLSAQH